ncbi:MAG: hypothetical protein ABFD25_03270 [Clostridiaceae bacterium]
MKVKFIEDYKSYCRGMQYEIEQVGKELAEQLEVKGIARIVPLPIVETEPIKAVEAPKKKGKK